RNRLPRHRGVPAGADLLRQPARRQCLRSHRLHHRGAGRHGVDHRRAARRPVRRRRGEPVGPLSRRVAGTNRHLPDVHPGPAVPAQRTVRRACMKRVAPAIVVVALLALVPLITASNTVLNFLVVALLIALVGQGWNVLGGYGGQYSFGHAAFFGTGAYVTAILQVRYGINAWVG